MTTEALDAVTAVDLGIASPADRALAALFDRHSSDAWHRRDVRAAALEQLNAGVCACGQPKQPTEYECNTCFLDFDDVMRRASDV